MLLSLLRSSTPEFELVKVWRKQEFGRPTCRDAGALLRAEAGHRAAARRTSSGALDMQLSVVVAVISYPGPVHWLNPGGRRPASGRVQSVVVGVDRVREAGGQHHRAAPVQQQRLLAARSAGQDAVYAEHPGGHHPGAETGKGKSRESESCSVKSNVLDWKIPVLRGRSSPKTASWWLWMSAFLPCMRDSASSPRGCGQLVLMGPVERQGWFYSPLTSHGEVAALGSAAAARGVNGRRSVYWELIQLR